MPLATILDWLPAHLKLRMKPDVPISGEVGLPLQTILKQMPQGRIRLSFREFKQIAPPHLFAATNEPTDDLIDLPLREIVSRLKPGQWPRRAEQKRVAVSKEINPIFGAPPEQRANQILSEPRGCLTREPGVATRSTASVDPESKNSVALERDPTLSAQAFAAQELPSENSDALSVGPARGGRVQAELGASGSGEFSMSLALLTGSWPEPIKQELGAIDILNASISIPNGELEQRLRRGKVIFKWQQLRLWIQPALALRAGAANDTIEVELPLATVAPAFVTQRRSIAQRKKQLELLATIPPLFAKAIPAAQSESPSQVQQPGATSSHPTESKEQRRIPAADVTEVARAGDPIPTESVPVSQSSADRQSEGALELGDIFGEPEKRAWSPADIVERTTQLGGIAGALLATFDGLVVASRLPAELNSARVAAFVPLMFGRITQYAKELNLGESNNLTFQLNDIPLHVAKAGRVYFASLGRADEPLPRADLTAIAAALARRGAAS